MSWMYGPSCTALPRIGSDCSTHPVWRHNDESTWAARIRVCCWLLFLMLVKVCVCHGTRTMVLEYHGTILVHYKTYLGTMVPLGTMVLATMVVPLYHGVSSCFEIILYLYVHVYHAWYEYVYTCTMVLPVVEYLVLSSHVRTMLVPQKVLSQCCWAAHRLSLPLWLQQHRLSFIGTKSQMHLSNIGAGVTRASPNDWERLALSERFDFSSSLYLARTRTRASNDWEGADWEPVEPSDWTFRANNLEPIYRCKKTDCYATPIRSCAIT
jgi:hypothetical protein